MSTDNNDKDITPPTTNEYTEDNPNKNVVEINIEEQMKTSYLDYSMSVIVGRALPDVRDGLKPVHRRILYGMNQIGVTATKPFKKSARIVGDVLGKYHPHGDTAVYDSMVRMAQNWTLRYCLVDGQGNFGSQDGDGPAAMRYTEARMHPLAEEMLKDIEKETVDFQLNFDDSLKEPTVLPSRIPQLLVNGTSGIAVGMATNMMPHNLTESINACVAYIENKEISIEELMTHVYGPDFPTGGIIYGMQGIRNAMLTGRGKVVVRGKVDIEIIDKGKEKIIIYEVPYQVNRDTLADKIGQLVNNKVIEGISEISNQSNKKGTRIVIELKRDAPPAKVIINQLYKYSELQTSYGINNVTLVKGRPKTLNLKDLIREFVEFRLEVIIRRTKYELQEAEKRTHILEGFLKTLDNLDEIINLIRNSENPNTAKNDLIGKYEFTDIQAKAILELRLQRLTGLERKKIKSEYEELVIKIKDYKEILASEERQNGIVKNELTEIKEKYGDERKSEIIPTEEEFDLKSIIEEEDVVITISHEGYIKRTPLDEYRQQKRGGRGARGSKTKESDWIEHFFIANTHHTLLFFTEKGKCQWLNVYSIPQGEKNTKGRAIQNILHIDNNDSIRAIIDVTDLKNEEYINNHYVILCTQKGIIKKTSLSSFSRPRVNGIIAITIQENDTLLSASLVSNDDEIILASKYGKAVRFKNEKVRSTGRGSIGVIGIKLADASDKVASMVTLSPKHNNKILVVSEKGYGKKTSFEEYRLTNRGASGVKTMNVTEKTGHLISMLNVYADEDLMITCSSGVIIRMAVSDIREIGRNTQGVKLISLDKEDTISAIAKTPQQQDEEQNKE